MANVSTEYNTERFSLGPAVVWIGDGLDTPTTNMGSVDSLDFEMNVEMAKIELGGPKVHIDSLPSRISAMVKFRGFEWSPEFFNWATGGAKVNGDKVTFGNMDAVSKFSLMWTHYVIGSGDVYTCRLWQVISEGNFPLSMAEGLHSFEANFSVLHSGVDWAGNVLGDPADKDSYLELVRTPA